jgi:Saxitoxin biosynthesis operon protein SxtJ
VSTHEDITRTFQENTASDRSFGRVFTVFFLLVGMLPTLRHGHVRVWALAVSGLFLLITLLRPTLFSGANKLWMKLSLLLSRIMNPLVIALMYYVVFVPVGLILRALGKDSLRLKPDRKALSYWVPRNPPGPGGGSMANQF